MTARPPYDLIVFDLDGTLVDSLPDIARALNATREEAGHAPLPVESIRSLVGDGAARLIERAFPPPLAEPREHQALLDRFMIWYAGAVCVGSRLYPGIRELLAALGDAGIKRAVLTNKPGSLARQLLRALQAEDTFLEVLGDGDGYPRKPDPTAARSLMQRAGVPCARTVVVGDGVPDVRQAQAIPCASIAAGWGYSPRPTLVAEHPSFLAPTVEDARRLLIPDL